MSIELDKVKKVFFLARQWNKEDNKKLLNIISKDRLDLEPATVYGLDSLGLDTIEIINLSFCVGKRFIDLSTSDIDDLNMIQDKYKCVFNFEEKQRFYDGELKTHPMKTKLNGYVSKPSGDYWLKSSALLKLSDNYG